jgi:hypothetical protein
MKLKLILLLLVQRWVNILILEQIKIKIFLRKKLKILNPLMLKKENTKAKLKKLEIKS